MIKIERFKTTFRGLLHQQREAMDENIWYFIILTILLIAAAIPVSVAPSESLSLPRLIVFWVLLVAHIGLHWFGSLFQHSAKSRAIYIVGQGVLTALLVILSASPTLTLMVFSVLISVSIGLFGLTRSVSLSVIFYLVEMVLCFLWVGGLPLLMSWLSAISINLLLLIVFMVLYRRQLDAKEKTQLLLTELEQANHQLLVYADQVEKITLAMERGRMARELHDTLAQGLAGLILQMEAVTDHMKHARFERSEAILQQAMLRARSTLSDTRNAIDDLRAESSALMLTQRIQAKITSLLVASPLEYHLEVTLAPETGIPPTVANHAVHIVGELVHNAVRHARASTLWLTITSDVQALTLQARDNGVGFDAASLPQSGHYGLQGIKERAGLSGGSISIESTLGQGTTVSVILSTEVL